MDNKKVCVVGMGGVGGYIGCIFAKHLDDVYFFVRNIKCELFYIHVLLELGLKIWYNESILIIK